VHLHAEARDLDRHLGARALHEGHEELVQGLLAPALVDVGVAVGTVEGAGGVESHRPATLGVRAHRHQHSPHVGVVDDGGAALHGAVDRPRLDALPGEGDRLLVRPLRHGDALHADGVARGVHHDEHRLEAAVLRAHEVADRAGAGVAELQHGGGAGLDAELVLDRRAPDVVALARAPVGIDAELRHDEEADPLHAFRCAADPRQHEVDDVLGEVVLTVGDVDLGAEDAVAAVALRLGAASPAPGRSRPAARSGSSCRSTAPRSSWM
jgi:hypothetical protein